jgi:hypothetical protein
MALEQMFLQFRWTKSQLLYEKTFWESELREAGFCKLLMNVGKLYIGIGSEEKTHTVQTTSQEKNRSTYIFFKKI